LTAAELPAGDALFSIQVRLNASTVQANGEHRALQAGMRLEADILQERRKIYEWILEPLFSIAAKQVASEAER
jgi:membrane fusion protein